MVCGAHPHQQDNLCTACRLDIPWSKNSCDVCATFLSYNKLDSNQICLDCLQEPPPYTKTICAFDYFAPISGLLNQFKHQRNLAAGRLLTSCLSKTITKVALKDKAMMPQLLIPVPLHKRRLRQRGFNQAQFIATGLSQSLNVRMNTVVCHRPEYQSPQQGQTRKQRLEQMKGIFKVTPKKADQRISRIAIIDDVMTTGATAQALSTDMLNSWGGPLDIQVWCVARAQPQNIRLDW